MSKASSTKNKCIQLLIGLASGIARVPQGIATTFPSTAFPQMALPESDLKPTRDESALIAGTLMYGMASCLIAGPLMDIIGRKRILIATTFPLIAGFILVATATSPSMIIVGRTIIGVACGIAVPVGSVYASETTETNMRGLVGSLASVLFALGCLTGYFLKLVTSSWRTFTWISISIPLLFFLILVFLPSSPRFLLMRGKTEEALCELKRLRSNNEEKVLKEFSSMEDYFTNQTKRPNTLLLIWKHKKILCHVICLGTFFGISGGGVIIAFAEQFLLRLEVSLSKDTLAFGIGTVHLIGAVISMFTSDRFGRKPLLFLCGFCMTLGWAFMAVYSYFSIHKYMSHPWRECVPFILISFIVLAFSFGYRCVIFVIVSEILPTEVRGVGTSIMYIFASVSTGCLYQSIIYMLDYMDMYGTSLVFACVNIVGVCYCKFNLFETKGKTLEAMDKATVIVKATALNKRVLTRAEAEETHVDNSV